MRDKQHAYSNLLGTLSALLSHEYFLMDSALFPAILSALVGNTEYNFSLTEKVNNARLHAIDGALSD